MIKNSNPQNKPNKNQCQPKINSISVKANTNSGNLCTKNTQIKSYVLKSQSKLY